ncbi:hypothetical protein BZA70DRAFT_285677 [Myxozyma melibiosi]|uniref:HTH APSES-type domain-containing protein n=1 Tax=Myxozyma melibiosi TaxID=54550 RepID=A0ABR1EYH7_9ASCO
MNNPADAAESPSLFTDSVMSGSRTSTPHSQETPPPPQLLSQAPATSSIYTAVYSGIPVYEMMVNGVAVMRRRSDSYLNATQILKVGGVDKGRRTKILEKEIHTGEHEKVQGGYGKYQGTWIPFARGREFCRQYSVEDVLLPLLNFDPAAPQSEQTPTKEQAMAARRKQMYAVASAQSSITSQPGNGSQQQPAPAPQLQQQQSSFATPMSSATAALNALGKAASRASFSAASDAATVSRQPTEAMGSFSGETATDVDDDEPLADADGPPRKRSRTEIDTQFQPPLPQQHSQQQQQHTDPPPSREQPLDPLDQHALGATYEQSRQIMTQIFMTNETSGVSQISLLDNANTPHVDVDVAIDDVGHASLHWAAALARVQLVRDLVSRGADPRRGNYAGETALVRAVTVTNNLDQSTFPAILDLLHPAIALTDKLNRTVLHHIALTAGIKGRAAASRYYLECLLEWIVRHGGAPEQGGLSLGRFMSEVVNAQDKNGDTSLNIAARIGNKAIVQQLLEVGADASIPNRAGLRPVDFGVGPELGEAAAQQAQQQPTQWLRKSAALVPPAVQQKSEDIIASMTLMISTLDKDFQEELQAKQTALDQLHQRLREATVTLTRARTKTEHLRRRANKLNELQQRDRNLENAIREEDARFRAAAAIGAAVAAVAASAAGAPSADNTLSEEKKRRMEQEPASDEVMNVGEGGDVTMADLDAIDGRPDTNHSHADEEIPADIDADSAFKIEGVEVEQSGGGGSGEGVNGSSSLEQSTTPTTTTTTKESTTIKFTAPLPPLAVLRARVSAYKRNRAHLSSLARDLRSRSSDLEDKFRGVVAKCTGVEKSRVDSLLEGLVQAVESDPGEVDMVRVAGFLRNVDDAQ